MRGRQQIIKAVLSGALVFSCGVLGACGNSGTQSSSSAPAQTFAASSSEEGTPLFDMYYSNEVSAFADGFDVHKVAWLEYERDEYETVSTRNKQVIQEVFEALAATRVLGEDKSGMVITDARSLITFHLNNGKKIEVCFDGGDLVVDGVMYECAPQKELTTALMDLTESEDAEN